MITKLIGILDSKSAQSIIVMVGGIGYELKVTMPTLTRLNNIGASITLWTHLYIREDAHTLYGFLDYEERLVFLELLKVSGIGPKSALNILSSIDANSLLQAIVNKERHILTKLPGIGAKTAERIMLDLSTALQNKVEYSVPNHSSTEALEALMALGYKALEAQKILMKVGKCNSVEDTIKQALRLLGS